MTILCSVMNHVPSAKRHHNQGLEFSICHRCGCDMIRIEEAAEQLSDKDRLEIDALQRNIKTNFQQIVSLSPLMSDDLQTLATNIAEPGRLADFIASSLGSISTETRQEVLATLDVRQRLDVLNRLLIKELEVIELESGKSPTASIIVLHGLGGVGKSFVALNLAAWARNHGVTTWWSSSGGSVATAATMRSTRSRTRPTSCCMRW